MFEHGRGIGQDREQAWEWYRKAADQGDKEAEIRIAAEQGDAEAQRYFGNLFLDADTWDEAYRWFEKAASQGDMTSLKLLMEFADGGTDQDASLILGRLFEQGNGVPQSCTEAAEWYRLAAEEQSEKASDALTCLRTGAYNGVAAYQYELGLMYKSGEGVSSDYEEGARWLRLAADQGHAAAQWELADLYDNLGEMYEEGEGVDQDYEKAADWYRKAAE